MHDELFASARRWAHQGIDAYSGHGEPRKDFAVHHGAVALEHLAKAYLYTINPALIAAGGFDTLLHLTGRSDLASTPRTHMKTITLAEANKRVKQILGQSYPYDGQADDLLTNVRNGVAHTAIWQQTTIRRALAQAVRRIDAILTALERSPDDFWASRRSLSQELVDDAISDIAVQVRAYIESAQRRYRQRFYVAPGQTNEVIQALTRNLPFATDHEVARECPACGNRAWLGGFTEVEQDRGLVEQTPNGWEERPVVVLYPHCLGCSVCGLYLDGADHFDQLGLNAEIELPDEDPEHHQHDMGRTWVHHRGFA